MTLEVPKSGNGRTAIAELKPIAGAYSRWATRLAALLANPFVAYVAILVLQLRVIWGVWRKDLTYGDTSWYFIVATSWAHGLHDNIIWSPLYTDALGTLLAVVHDVPLAMTIHRVAIVLAACLLVLAVMRSLLGPTVGFLVACWWAVLQPNFGVLYEVHLFGLLPVLIAALILANGATRRRRGIALGILTGTTLLLRNELAIATVLFAAAIVYAELRERRRRQVSVSSYLHAYGIPLAIVAALFLGAYSRSFIQGNNARVVFGLKQGVNMCQVYAFSYQQEHPDRFTGSPWTGCTPLMQQTFGKPYPTLFRAAVANPRAFGGFLRWNAGLLPAGAQVSLFGATSGGKDPDFVPVALHRGYAAVLSVLALALLGTGLTVLIRDRDFWRREWLPDRRWTLGVVGAAAVTALYVAMVERPRPEYLYGLTVAELALLGLCASALLRRVGGARLVAPIALALFLVCLVPTRYHSSPRPIYNAYERLQVVHRRLQTPGSVLVASAYNSEICNYLAKAHDRTCSSPSWETLAAQTHDGKTIERVLEDAKVTVIYADPTLQADPILAPLLTSPRSNGWRYVSSGIGPDGHWGVLVPLAHGAS